MSSETKKHKGEAGVSNAENAPWRLNGRRADWMAAQIGCHKVPVRHSPHSRYMQAIYGGMIAGTDPQITEPIAAKFNDGLANCPTINALLNT